jgi:hypothetical protein
MTDQEKADLEAMLARKQEIQNTCFSMLASLDKAGERELETSGCKGLSNAEAMRKFFQIYQRDIKKLIDSHVRKYPD